MPTGNFGNILAAYFAKEMGLPISRLICASNTNRVLTDFFESNVYDAKRDFYATSSPSMDILISSNLERLLYYVSNRDTSVVASMMQNLREKGEYQVKDTISELISGMYAAGSCDDAQTKETIASVYYTSSYLCDTHTAVGIKVYRDYKAQTGDETKTVIASTASPFKFCESVLSALGIPAKSDGTELIEILSSAANIPAPKPLMTLSGLPERFSKSVPKEKIADAVLEMLGL